MNLKTVALFLGMGVAVLAPSSSPAMCTDNRHPSVSEEYGSSKLVLVGRVEREDSVVSHDDPDGVEAYRYRIAPVQVFKGQATMPITLRTDNTSSRFPMDVGKEYLLFVSVYPDAMFVDSCGNSGLVSEKGQVLSSLRRDGQRHRPSLSRLPLQVEINSR